MTLELGPLEGGVRLRIGEPEWAAVVAATGMELPLGPAPLDGAPEAYADAGPGLDAAVRLVATAPIVLSVLSGRPGLGGFLARIGTDGRTCAGVVRVVGEQVRPTPGVEVSAFEVADLGREIARLMPPPAVRWADEVDDPAARATLVDGLTGDATIILEQPGNGPLLLRLLVGSAGWVELGLSGGRPTHRALDEASLGAIVERQVARAATPDNRDMATAPPNDLRRCSGNGAENTKGTPCP